jgi:hypothetical protein
MGAFLRTVPVNMWEVSSMNVFAKMASRILVAAVMVVGVAACSGVDEGASDDVGEIDESLYARGCATLDLPVVERAAIDELIARRQTELLFKPGGGPATIRVWFHVIYDVDRRTGAEVGNVSDAVIEAQVRVLNESFGSGFGFTLAGVTRTHDSKWFRLTGGGLEADMKKTLKVGGPDTLNIYTNNMGRSLLGWAYYPSIVNSSQAYLDGVVLHYGTLPGGHYDPYNEGDTGTHEVGHWLNLAHTFEGGCREPGDSVDDTPAEASPASGCPVGRDTCPDDPGLDPVENFMDYTIDSCMFTFSVGQHARMAAAWDLFRKPSQ